MASALGKSDTSNCFFDCSIIPFLPRTLGFSLSSGTNPDDLTYISNLFNSTTLNKSTHILELANMIKSGNCSSAPNSEIVETINSSNKRNCNSQIDSPGKRVCERQSDLLGFESKTTTSESSPIGTLADLSKTGCAEPSSVAECKRWPDIDYNSLKHISDPEEYFLAWTKLTNAEKEKRKLKGETSPKLQPRVRGPQHPVIERLMKNYVFKLRCETSCAESSSATEPKRWPTIDYSILKQISDPREYFLSLRRHENAEKEIRRLKGEPSPKLQPRVRKPGPRHPVIERLMKNYVFKLRNKTSTSESSHIGTLADSSKTVCAELNAEKEIRRLKGETSLKLSPPQRRDHQHRPELPLFEGRKHSFKMPVIPVTVEDSRTENSLPYSLNSTELTNASYFKEISQVNLQTVELGSKLFRRAETHNDTEVVEIPRNELYRLLSRSKEICNDSVEKFIRELQFNPNPVDKSRGLPFSISTENKPASPKRREIYPPRSGTTFDEVLSNMKERLAFRIKEYVPYTFPESNHDRQSKDSGELSSNPKILNTNRLAKLLSYDTDVQNKELGNLKSDCNDNSAVGITELELEIVKTKLLDAQAPLSVLEMAVPLTGVQSEYVKIAALKSDILQNPAESQQLMLPGFSSEDEMHSPEDVTFEKGERLSDNAVDQQMELPCEVLNGNMDEGCSESLGSPHKNFEIEEHPLHREKKQNEKLRRKICAGGSSNKNLERGKSQRCYGKKQNKDMRRKSLSGAGTVWESGVRRSTRIRVKPLQHWCGERLLYGRVHDSMATVIGLKKLETPPAKGLRKKATMRVESFVQEQYADLVAKAALY